MRVSRLIELSLELNVILRGGEETSGHTNYGGVGIDFSFRAKITLFLYCEVLEEKIRSTLTGA